MIIQVDSSDHIRIRLILCDIVDILHSNIPLSGKFVRWVFFGLLQLQRMFGNQDYLSWKLWRYPTKLMDIWPKLTDGMKIPHYLQFLRSPWVTMVWHLHWDNSNWGWALVLGGYPLICDYWTRILWRRLLIWILKMIKFVEIFIKNHLTKRKLSNFKLS